MFLCKKKKKSNKNISFYHFLKIHFVFVLLCRILLFIWSSVTAAAFRSNVLNQCMCQLYFTNILNKTASTDLCLQLHTRLTELPTNCRPSYCTVSLQQRELLCLKWFSFADVHISRGNTFVFSMP